MNGMVKKSVRGFLAVLLGAACTFGAAADGSMPLTGEQRSIMPFILAGAAVIIIAALVVLSVVTKKK